MSKKQPMRTLLREEVRSRAVGCAHCELVGSWARGDFHFVLESKVSFSDVDVYCPRECRRSVRELTAPRLSHRLRFSQRSEQYARTISLPDAALLGLLLLGDQKFSEAAQQAYLRAKVGLLWLRTSVTEDYRSVGTRLSSPAVDAAVRVKMGEQSYLPESFVSVVTETLHQFSWADLGIAIFSDPSGHLDEERTWSQVASTARETIVSVSGRLIDDLVARTCLAG